MQTYIFCENDIDEYEKLILSLAISYAHSPMFSLKEEDIAGLSDFLRIDFQLLKKALSVSERDTRDVVTVKFGEDKIEYSGLADNIFFTVLVRIYFIYESFSKLNREVDYDAIKYNVGIFLSIVHEFDMIHSAIATYECMYHGAFSFDYTVFNDGNFRPMDFIRMLQLYMTCEDSMFFNNSIVSLNYILLRYEFYMRINTLYLIAITQIYKHSSFLNSNVRKIANELYEHLLFILKNGRIISIQTNILHVMKKEKIINRGREANTTRMQIIYGYGNFDTYVLRLDLGHKGEELIHWNNKSPGGIKCCLFSKEEHQVIVKIHPEMESCFTNYDDRWGIMPISALHPIFFHRYG